MILSPSCIFALIVSRVLSFNNEISDDQHQSTKRQQNRVCHWSIGLVTLYADVLAMMCQKD
ncbi:MAG: hypothetical protein KBG64_01655, partial [Clostridia bacterium]|nr:hypothetical protein [Clostridia bacterium]